MSVERSISRQLQQAIDHVEATGPVVFDESRYDHLRIYQDWPDDAEVDINTSDELPEQLPHQVLVDSYESLVRAIGNLNWWMANCIDPGRIEAVLKHEKAHAGYSELMGYQNLHFGLGIYDVQNFGGEILWNAFHIPFGADRPVTKLGYAAIVAAPDDKLNVADEWQLNTIGYRSRSDVIGRIRSHNATGSGRELPVPSKLLAA